MIIIIPAQCLSPMKKTPPFKKPLETFEVQGSRNRNWENMETKTNNLPSSYWCSPACQEEARDWKLHHSTIDPGIIRITELQDCPPWDCSDTQDVTIHQVIHETYDCPKFMEWAWFHKRKLKSTTPKRINNNINHNHNHNYNKIVKFDWLSTALISALIGQFNRTVRVMPK